jgi:hypothetical protein
MRVALACRSSSCQCAHRGNLHCPAHEDWSPSLSASIKADKLLFKCHAGCAQRAVINAMVERGLWEEQKPLPSHQRPSLFQGESIESWYDYRDRDGRLVYAIGRTPSKQFPLFRLEGRTWKPGLGERQRILYRVPELSNEGSVLIVEGEKDVDRAVAEGFIATTTPGGAGKSHLCDLSPLSDRDVVLIPDKDEPGRAHMATLAKQLASISASVRTLELPDLAQKDLSDYFDAGGTRRQLVEFIAGPEHDAPVTPQHQSGLIDWPSFWLAERNVEDWLIKPWIPRGRSIALYSPAKQGKSLLALDLVACAATGSPTLGQSLSAPINVVYFDLEMTDGDLQERLRAMGYGPDSDLSHLSYYLLPTLPPFDTAEGGAVAVKIARQHDAQLVVIDTTSRVLEGSENDADTLRRFHLHTGVPLKADGRTVLRLDHSGKDLTKGQRGTSAKNDDVDLVWELSARAHGAVRLRATHRRQSWVPPVIDLVRLKDPLRHEVAFQPESAGIHEIVRLLDDLGLPIEDGARRARELLRSRGHSVGNDRLAAALRYRKAQESESRTHQEATRTLGADTTRFGDGDTHADTHGYESAAEGDTRLSMEPDTLPGSTKSRRRETPMSEAELFARR